MAFAGKKPLKRLTRRGYLKRMACLCIPLLILWGYVELNFMSFRSDVTLETPLGIGLYAYAVCGVALYVYWSMRRQHDFNEPAWKIVYLLIPLFNLVWIVVLFTTSGTIGHNRYGHDPLHRQPFYETSCAPKRGG
ncbi:MAG: DUF805 domain-containing protein [Alloprevotella sp.]